MTKTTYPHGARGFASMDPARQREIASQGGKAAQTKGTGRQWTREEAIAAARKGAESRWARKAA